MPRDLFNFQEAVSTANCSTTCATLPLPSASRSSSRSQASSASHATGFAAAVAGPGQLLRGDPHLPQFGYDAVLALGEGTRGTDRLGYRSEFLNLVCLAKSAPALETVAGAARDRL